ncbi:MAG: c-type cytochrome [Chloroflexota bacterium]|nr:c-type cytochrome [Chloroflexota bacterium]
MRDKVILGVTLSIVLLLTLVIYGLVDTNRGPTTTEAKLEHDVNQGRVLFASYCIQCHGPLGEGCIGPALNRAQWHPKINGAKNPNYDEASHDFIKKTLINGRAANQPGIQMPAWSTTNGGALNDEELEELIAFIQGGDWSQTLQYAVSAANLNEPLPSYKGFPDNQLQKVKETMLAKGCLNCHQLGKAGGAVGAVLSDVGSRRTAQWLRNWIHDPKSVAAKDRGPNLWLVAPTATIPPPESPVVSLTPSPTAQIYPMNATYMPTIPMTDEELNLLVNYLSHARTTK